MTRLKNKAQPKNKVRAKSKVRAEIETSHRRKGHPRSLTSAVHRRPSSSLRDLAHQEIKKRIVTLTYRPGAYLNEAQICADLKIGRTPVHMALQRLSIDGMIDIIPRKGAIVRPVSIDEIMSVIEARLCNEPMAARLAANRVSNAQIERLTEIVAESHARTAQQDVEALLELDRELHSVIAEATRNTVLVRILTMLHERSLRLWFISLSEPTRLDKVAHEHANILAAISSKDEARAELVMREHIESFARTITASISSYELPSVSNALR